MQEEEEELINYSVIDNYLSLIKNIFKNFNLKIIEHKIFDIYFIYNLYDINDVNELKKQIEDYYKITKELLSKLIFYTILIPIIRNNILNLDEVKIVYTLYIGILDLKIYKFKNNNKILNNLKNQKFITNTMLTDLNDEINNGKYIYDFSYKSMLNDNKQNSLNNFIKQYPNIVLTINNNVHVVRSSFLLNKNVSLEYEKNSVIEDNNSMSLKD